MRIHSLLFACLLTLSASSLWGQRPAFKDGNGNGGDCGSAANSLIVGCAGLNSSGQVPNYQLSAPLVSTVFFGGQKNDDFSLENGWFERIQGYGTLASEIRVQTLISAPTLFSNARCNVVTSPGVGVSFTWTLRVNGVTPSSGPVCTITGATTTGVDSSGGSLVTKAGDLVNWILTTTGSVASAINYSSVSIVSNQIVDTFNWASSGRTLTTAYHALAGSNFSTTEGNAVTLISIPTTLFGSTCWTAPALTLGQSLTFTLHANGAAPANGPVCSIVGPGSMGTDTGGRTYSAVAGDVLDWKQSAVGISAGTSGVSVAIQSTASLKQLTGSAGTDLSSINNKFMDITSWIPNAISTENQTPQYVAPISTVFSRAACGVTTAPGGGSSITFTLRVNAATPSGGPTCTITGSAVQGVDTSGGVYTASVGDLIDWLVTTSGSPASGTNAEYATIAISKSPQSTCGDLSNASPSCSIDATNGTNISSGTVNAARLPGSGNTNINGVTCTIGSSCLPNPQTVSNCSSGASPAVCGSSAAGSVAIPTGTVSETLTVNTSAVTANSQILLTSDDTLGAKLGVTCNSTLSTLVGGLAVTARTASTSFQISYNGNIVTNPLCVSYYIIN